MPYRSDAQRRYFHANLPKLAKEWDAATPKGPLPEHVAPKPKPKKSKVRKVKKAGK